MQMCWCDDGARPKFADLLNMLTVFEFELSPLSTPLIDHSQVQVESGINVFVTSNESRHEHEEHKLIRANQMSPPKSWRQRQEENALDLFETDV